MKFTMNSKVFKSITERAAVVCPKKPILPVLTGLIIVADKDNQMVIIKSTNVESYAEIYTDCVDVSESGKVIVEIGNVKRLYNVVGDMTIESTEKTIKARSSKKQIEVYTMQEEDLEFPVVEDDNRAFSADKMDMLETFSKLSCCLSVSERNPVHSGFNIANGRIASVDGSRAAIRAVYWNFREGLNITIPGCIVKELTKVSANKQKEHINVFADRKWAKFIGVDFTYTVKLLEGNFINVENVMSNDGLTTYNFSVNAEDLSSMAKEYSSMLKNTKESMHFCYLNNRLVTEAKSDKCRVFDVLEIKEEENIPEKLNYAFNPIFIKEVAQIFDEQEITIKGDVRRIGTSPWKIYGENGYSAIILPMRWSKEDWSDVEEFLASA